MRRCATLLLAFVFCAASSALIPCQAGDTLADLARAAWGGQSPASSSVEPSRGPSSAAAAPMEAGQLAINGPAEAALGEDVDLVVTGAGLDELIEARRDGRLDLTFWPVEDADLDPGYDWITDAVELEFTADRPGLYLVKLSLVRLGRLETAQIVVSVIGEVPPANPYPAPGAELRRLVEPVTRLTIEPGEAERIAAVYWEIGEAVKAVAPAPSIAPQTPPVLSVPPLICESCSLPECGPSGCKANGPSFGQPTTKSSPRSSGSKSGRSIQRPIRRSLRRWLGR